MTFGSSEGTYGASASVLSVRVGSGVLNEGGEVIPVQAVYNHPNFNSYLLDFDFALLRLKTDIKFDGVTTAAVPLPPADQEIVEDSPVLVSGWGLTKKSSESNKKLRGVVIPTINQAQCNQIYSRDGGVSKQMLCAGSSGRDSCNVGKFWNSFLTFWLIFSSQGDSGEWSWQMGTHVNFLSNQQQVARCDEYPTEYWLVLFHSEWIVPIRTTRESTRGSLPSGHGSSRTLGFNCCMFLINGNDTF